MGELAPRPGTRRQFSVVLAFAFGSIFLLVVLLLAFDGSPLDDRQFEILRIVVALAGGGIGGIIPGFLDLNVKPSAKATLRAGGGLAVFVVLYFWSPAHWVNDQLGPVIQKTTGACSPVIHGSHNTVLVGSC